MRKLLHQARDEYTTVRMAAALMPPLEHLVKNARDEFGLRLFRSKSEAVTEAVKELLKKYSKDQGFELKLRRDRSKNVNKKETSSGGRH